MFVKIPETFLVNGGGWCVPPSRRGPGPPSVPRGGSAPGGGPSGAPADCRAPQAGMRRAGRGVQRRAPAQGSGDGLADLPSLDWLQWTGSSQNLERAKISGSYLPGSLTFEVA